MEARNWTGEWWLPETPERRVSGTLTLDSDEFVLATIGALRQPPMPEPGVVFRSLSVAARHDVIHGQIATGHRVTLIDCAGRATIAPFAQVKEAWRPRAALVGAHLHDPKERSFEGFTLDLEHLAAFADSPGLDVKVQTGQNGLELAEFRAERRVLQHAVVHDTAFDLVVMPKAGWGQATAELAVEVRLEITPSGPIDWEDAWTDFVIPLRNFLVVLAGRACAVRGVWLRRVGADGAREEVQLLRRTNDLRRSAGEPLSTDDFVAHAGNLPDGFETTLGNWWRLLALRRVAIREYTDILHAPFAYAEDRLLAYTRAVAPLLTAEMKLGSKRQAQSEQEAWLAKVAAALPDDLRDGVMGRLSPAGPNDRNRLVSLVMALGPLGLWLTGGDVDEFAARVIATRVYLAHPSQDPPAKLLKDADLALHTRALGWLLRASLFRDLGFPLDELMKRLHDTDAAGISDALAEAGY